MIEVTSKIPFLSGLIIISWASEILHVLMSIGSKRTFLYSSISGFIFVTSTNVKDAGVAIFGSEGIGGKEFNLTEQNYIRLESAHQKMIDGLIAPVGINPEGQPIWKTT